MRSLRRTAMRNGCRRRTNCACEAAAIFSLLLVTAAATRADDWPHWQGPHFDGTWNESGILHSFPRDGLKIRWRTPVGPGFSSPVVAGERVYLTDAELIPPKARERVHCFDQTSGKPLWAFAYEVAYPAYAFSPPPGMGPTATPAVDGRKVYSLGSLGHLFCLSAIDGTMIWEKNLGAEYKVPEFSFNASALIDGGLLILFIGGKPRACVIALDKNTGKEVWRALEESSTNSTPLILTTGGKRQLIVWTQESVSALDPQTGRIYWRVPLRTSRDQAVSTPVAYHNLLLIGGLMLKLDAYGTGASILWPTRKAVAERILSNTSTALIQGDYVFSARSTGDLVCLEAKTGAQLWASKKVTDASSGPSIHLTPNDDRVFLYTNLGELILARLTGKSYTEIGRARLLQPTYPFAGRNVAWAPPGYANRCVFARSDKELVCASLAQ